MANRLMAVITIAMIFGISAGVVQAQPGSRSTSAVSDFIGAGAAGHTTLVRAPNGLSATWESFGTGVEPGFAYTFWYVIFNEPGACISDGGCGADDIFVNPVPAVTDVLFGGGAIAGNNGWIRMAGHRKQGDNSGSAFTFFGLDAPGLIDPFVAEVHLVLRSHGPVIPAELANQIGSFEGGCLVFLGPPANLDIPAEENECADIQFSIHLP